MKRFVLMVLGLYRRAVSPALGPCCRFEPSCSHYAMEALKTHGAVAGTVLTVRRVLRCNPWGGMGYDPVPAPGKTWGAGRLDRPRPTTVLRF